MQTPLLPRKKRSIFHRKQQAPCTLLSEGPDNASSQNVVQPFPCFPSLSDIPSLATSANASLGIRKVNACASLQCSPTQYRPYVGLLGLLARSNQQDTFSSEPFFFLRGKLEMVWNKYGFQMQ
jgi:hypothetical protein